MAKLNIVTIIIISAVICVIIYCIVKGTTTEKFSGGFDPSTRLSIRGIGPTEIEYQDNCKSCM